MAGFLASRRRLLAAKGRPVVLQRPNDSPRPTDLTVQGYNSPGVTGPDRPPETQDDSFLHILDDERAAASWPTPGLGTWAVIDGVTWAARDATPAYDGKTLIGWTLTLRGGQP